MHEGSPGPHHAAESAALKTLHDRSVTVGLTFSHLVTETIEKFHEQLADRTAQSIDKIK